MNTLVKNNGTWWYVKGGYVRFDYTGTVEYGGSWWYVKSGRIDFSYNGDANVNGMTYHVSNGKVTGYASKLYTVTDPNSDMYGQTLKLYYSPSGELVSSMASLIRRLQNHSSSSVCTSGKLTDILTNGPNTPG